MTADSPERRSEIARKAAAGRQRLDAYLEELVDRAPPLTESQRAVLAVLFRPDFPKEAHHDDETPA